MKSQVMEFPIIKLCNLPKYYQVLGNIRWPSITMKHPSGGLDSFNYTSTGIILGGHTTKSTLWV